MLILIKDDASKNWCSVLYHCAKEFTEEAHESCKPVREPRAKYSRGKLRTRLASKPEKMKCRRRSAKLRSRL
jgi:hypothetical protein